MPSQIGLTGAAITPSHAPVWAEKALHAGSFGGTGAAL